MRPTQLAQALASKRVRRDPGVNQSRNSATLGQAEFNAMPKPSDIQRKHKPGTRNFLKY